MEVTTTFVTISAGLLLSVALATLIEELVIGGLFRIFFAFRSLGSRQKPSRRRDNP
jgi:hypothetical protein